MTTQQFPLAPFFSDLLLWFPPGVPQDRGSSFFPVLIPEGTPCRCGCSKPSSVLLFVFFRPPFFPPLFPWCRLCPGPSPKGYKDFSRTPSPPFDLSFFPVSPSENIRLKETCFSPRVFFFELFSFPLWTLSSSSSQRSPLAFLLHSPLFWILAFLPLRPWGDVLGGFFIRPFSYSSPAESARTPPCRNVD